MSGTDASFAATFPGIYINDFRCVNVTIWRYDNDIQKSTRVSYTNISNQYKRSGAKLISHVIKISVTEILKSIDTEAAATIVSLMLVLTMRADTIVETSLPSRAVWWWLVRCTYVSNSLLRYVYKTDCLVTGRATSHLKPAQKSHIVT